MNAVSERCHHAMLRESCAWCSPPRQARVPVRTRQRTVFGSGAGHLDLSRHGIVIVHTNHRTSREHMLLSIAEIDPKTEVVHINGLPFLWAFEAILARLPNLKTIQVIPSSLDRIMPGARSLCADRGVAIVGGHVRPELAWSDGRIGNPQYAAQRKFLLSMSGEQRALFDELIALGFDCAKMAARYFCLADEEYVPQHVIGSEYGYSKTTTLSVVSGLVLGVLYYLDGTIEVGETSKRTAASLREQVARLRPLLASVEHRQRMIRELGVPSFAPGFPLARVDVFAKVLAALRSGRLAKLRLEDPRSVEVLTLRFGLTDLQTPTYLKLREVGERMGGVTRERARQLEEKALAALGIKDEAG